MTLVLLNLALIATNRSAAGGTLAALRAPNSALGWIAAGAVAALAACLALAPLRELLRFAPLSARELGVAVLAAVAGFAAFEGLRALGRRGVPGTVTG